MTENRIEQLTTEPENLTFEQAFARLEEIVEKMETGEQTLENALADFEEARLLARRCARLLEQAELKVRQLSGEDLIDPELEI
ncbi:MAG: exodeoxyribonuclease VII small subunit [Anaerolineae bacterium UTCFX2]|jgi:exodeoxyribonuclease VII small subunit|nr:exodeoxyribonuclease VII small subunit [Anaerolineales bacterium]OQY89676.1 MAG: exodeoxyribonuclease VII small subunit [Anaerolineae bacterium UTCFX2]